MGQYHLWRLFKIILVAEILVLFWLVVLVPSWSWPSAKLFVTNTNHLPVANAGTDISVNELDGSVLLNGGRSSDEDSGQSITYFWSELVDEFDGCSLLGSTTQTPKVILKNSLDDYACTFRLEVSDGQGESLPDQVAVSVLADDQAPVFSSTGLISFAEGQVGVTNIIVDDPENGEIDFKVEDVEGDFLKLDKDLGALFTIQSNKRIDFSWTPTFTEAGEYQFAVMASDGSHASTQEFTLEVTNVNQPPVLTQSLPDISVFIGNNTPGVNLNEYFSDPDGQNLTFTVVEDSDLTVSLVAGELSVLVPSAFKGPSEMYFIAAEAIGEIAVSNVISVELALTQATDTPQFVTGTTRGVGKVKVTDKDHQLLYEWVAFDKGGVLPKLLFISDQAYVLATKYSKHHRFEVFSAAGQSLDVLRLSSAVSWNYSLSVETDHNPLTSELLMTGRRGTMIFLKILKFDSSTQRLNVSQSTKVPDILDSNVTFSFQDSSVLVTDASGKTVFFWNL